MALAAIQAAIAQIRESREVAQAPMKQGAGDFAEQLNNAITKVDAAQHESDELLAKLASGESVDLHNTMISLQKADISMRTLVAVRDKVVSAYEQILNMSV
jgi:flagellar hook-basal body complex protein FliE